MDYMRLFMGYFFVAVSILKMADWKGFVRAFSKYDLLAKNMKGYAALYPLIELGLGISYIYAWHVEKVALLTFVIMVIGAIGIYRNLISPNRVKCACLGTLIKIPLTKFTLVEDIVMALMALGILLTY